MDKSDWEKSLNSLIVMKDKHEKDLEEVSYMIECYENKIKTYI